MKFHEKRRQQFLSEEYFQADIKHSLDISLPGLLQVLDSADSDSEDRSRVSGVIAYIKCKNFFLRFTAGESVTVLHDSFIVVVEEYERAARYYREYTKSSDSPIFGFQEIDDFERIIQLISLAILLHRRELIPRIHSLIANSAYDGKDALYEELIGHYLEDRPFLDVWYHQMPYIHLLNATDEEGSEGKVVQMEEYLKVWYKSMRSAGWHDSHLDMREDGGAYFGYWAIEAAAIVYLYNIDDSSFRDHIVYPKDLADFAKGFDKTLLPTVLAPEKLRVEGGNPCPQAGYWFTPAITNSLRYFEQGEIMPESPDSHYGVTIWQWSTEQPPNLKPTAE